MSTSIYFCRTVSRLRNDLRMPAASPPAPSFPFPPAVLVLRGYKYIHGDITTQHPPFPSYSGEPLVSLLAASTSWLLFILVGQVSGEVAAGKCVISAADGLKEEGAGMVGPLRVRVQALPKVFAARTAAVGMFW